MWNQDVEEDTPLVQRLRRREALERLILKQRSQWEEKKRNTRARRGCCISSETAERRVHGSFWGNKS
ncbi:hypothetical protein OIU84_024916 [Salix udensis]|uniref:Uncharacterized protein n=1 Tax=Salix udensis TaxID=889485 RepID=A0AAD6PB67_9ROSI|nr:hypothetical protein OIU84_024916 [Salix udensis]